jgi:hypothetical protein
MEGTKLVRAAPATRRSTEPEADIHGTDDSEKGLPGDYSG